MNDTDNRLASVFNFTEDDLAANLQGYLTPTQKKVLAETRRARGCGARIAYIIMAGSVVIFVVAFVLGGGLNAPLSTGALTAYAVAISVFIGIFLLSMAYSRVLSRDLRTGKISVAEGPARRRTKEYRLGTAFFVKIGRRRFQLAYPEQFAAFDEGTYYRIYYVKNPPLHLILSIETVKS
ncbi:MAG: hypothetical protein JSW52_06740 [Candidatus Coatesbacteria bacterium]|nr:MAG: hypothetical protein JSW52_06740 [Candidatus Coatesbacteria bacterium]